MSDQYHPDFTVFGAIVKTIRVIRDEFQFFAILIFLYTIVSTVSSLYLFDGVDLTNPAASPGDYGIGGVFFIIITVFFYLLYAIYLIFILDRANANLNGYSFHDYPYLPRALKTVFPVILLYVIFGILAGTGFLLLIIPGLIVVAGLYLMIPIKLAENIDIASAISRSWNLSKGNRLGIWGVILIPIIPLMIITFTSLSYFAAELNTVEDFNAAFSPMFLIVSGLINGFFTVFYTTASGVVYHQIKMEKITD